MRRLIIYLVRKRLGVKKFQNFRFTNQKEKDKSMYYFTNYELKKVEYIGNGDNMQERVVYSNASLNWLVNDDCKIDIVAENRE